MSLLSSFRCLSSLSPANFTWYSAAYPASLLDLDFLRCQSRWRDESCFGLWGQCVQKGCLGPMLTLVKTLDLMIWIYIWCLNLYAGMLMNFGCKLSSAAEASTRCLPCPWWTIVPFVRALEILACWEITSFKCLHKSNVSISKESCFLFGQFKSECCWGSWQNPMCFCKLSWIVWKECDGCPQVHARCYSTTFSSWIPLVRPGIIVKRAQILPN